MSEYEIHWIGIGDIHGDIMNIDRIPGLSDAEGVIISGDLTTHGNVRARNPKVYAQIGNMDSQEINAWLEQEGVNIHAKGLMIGPGVGLVGVGTSSPTPFNTPSEYPDTRLGEWLEAGYSQLEAADHLLLVAHDPPRGTKADVVGGGQHVGSEAVREFIERVRPQVCLTGHIHEARSRDRLEDTIVINPGMLSRGGYAVIGLKDGKLTAELKTA
jgi:hypothetical protein